MTGQLHRAVLSGPHRSPSSSVFHMKRVVRVGTVLLGVYLALGLLFALNYGPQQMWACPDATQPHGYVWHSTEQEGCEPTWSRGEQAVQITALTVLWGPLVVMRGAAQLGGGPT